MVTITKESTLIMIVFIILIALICYMLWSKSTIQESFTTSDLNLAKAILTYLQSPNNYIGYVNLLVANNNTSTNLAKQDTYNALVAQSTKLTVADILADF